MWFICLLIGLAIGAGAVYYFQQTKNLELDQQTALKNQELQIELAQLQTRKEEILANISELQAQAQQVGQQFLEQNKNLAEVQFEHSAEVMARNFQEQMEKCEQEYLNLLEEASADASVRIKEYTEELSLLESAIADRQAILHAAVEASKRAVEMENKLNFYRLNLTETDINEIKKLREVLPYLRDSEPLNKVIWKVYYEKPYTDLIGRIVGSKVRMGIYKITNIENNMCYVGQAVDIAARWKTHIKRGIGAEAPTRNKLYPAMLNYGVENFTFEIVEECDKTMLDSREDYWQDYFKAKEFGYSIK